MGRLSKFWSLTPCEKQLFFEAFILLLITQLSVKFISFKYIYNFLLTNWNDIPASTLERTGDIRLVDVSLSRAASILPWKSLCLSRSIAALVIFRRRWIPAVLFAVLKFAEPSLFAHALVQAGREVLDEEAGEAPFRALIRIGEEPLMAGSAASCSRAQ